jgi:hypothetical protein
MFWRFLPDFSDCITTNLAVTGHPIELSPESQEGASRSESSDPFASRDHPGSEGSASGPGGDRLGGAGRSQLADRNSPKCRWPVDIPIERNIVHVISRILSGMQGMGRSLGSRACGGLQRSVGCRVCGDLQRSIEAPIGTCKRRPEILRMIRGMQVVWRPSGG